MNDKKDHNIRNDKKKTSFVHKPDGILVIESSMVGITMQGMQQNRIHAPHTVLMV